MTEAPNTWQAVQAEVLRRIRTRQWAQGAAIPHEADLAQELGCARATVNRALREVAAMGLIERRRRAGSRVALRPVRRATLVIPVIRDEIEQSGARYGYRLIARDLAPPPPAVETRLALRGGRALLHVTGLHLADGLPHVIEDRWIDPEAVPGVLEADFSAISANEWLVLSIPFEGGDIAFSATAATAPEALLLGCGAGEALFVTERTTWRGERRLTTVRLTFAPGYRLSTLI